MDTTVTKSIQTILSALIPMYLIILSGASSVYLKILPTESVTYFSQFVFYYALPALLFVDVAKTPQGIDKIRFDILLATFAGTTILWLLMVVICLVTYRKNVKQFGYAGIFSLCTTFSSSVFIAYPLVRFLDEEAKDGLDFSIYCSLCFVLWNLTIVPLSILLLETFLTHKRMEDPEAKPSAWQIRVSRYFRAVLRSLVNPITIPVVLGMIVWAVRSNVTTFPPFIALVGNIIAHWTTMMGRAATSAALFVIGMSMYGKALFGENVFSSLALIFLKQVVAPILVTAFLHATCRVQGITIPDTRALMATYLINMVPPAQVTYLLSIQYRSVGLEFVSSSLVLGGLLCFPIVLISMAFLPLQLNEIFVPLSVSGEPEYVKWMRMTNFLSMLGVLRVIAITISILGMIAAVWVFLPSLFDAKYKNSMRRLVAGLAIAQFLASLNFMISALINAIDSTVYQRQAWLCVTQGFLVQLFIFAGMMYFFCISLHILLKFVFGLSIKWHWEVWYHIVAWGVAILSACIPVFLTFIQMDLGYGPGASWCWITKDYMQMAMLYAPFILFALFGILVLITVYRKVVKNTSMTFMPKQYAELKTKLLWKCTLFIAVFILIWIWGLCHRLQQMIYARASYDHTPKSVFLLIMLHTICTAGQAIGTFFVFGTGKTLMQDYSTFWGKIFSKFKFFLLIARAIVFGRKFELTAIISGAEVKAKKDMLDNMQMMRSIRELDEDDTEHDDEEVRVESPDLQQQRPSDIVVQAQDDYEQDEDEGSEVDEFIYSAKMLRKLTIRNASKPESQPANSQASSFSALETPFIAEKQNDD